LEERERQRQQQEWIDKLRNGQNMPISGQQDDKQPEKNNYGNPEARGHEANDQPKVGLDEEYQLDGGEATKIVPEDPVLHPEEESDESEVFEDVKVDVAILQKRQESTPANNNVVVKKQNTQKDMFAMDDDSSDDSQEVGEAIQGRAMDFDDEEQYYKTQIGELLHQGQFLVIEQMGKGMYGTVLRAKQTSTQTNVAIKVGL
jgi:hypothetical protein